MFGKKGENWYVIWAPPSEFVSSSIPSWQILTAHAQPFRGARDLAFCLYVPLDSLLVWASSGGFGETARMRRLAWTFAARIGDKYQIRLTRSICIIVFVHRGKKGFGFKRVILFSNLGGEFGDDQLDTICAGIRNSEIELNVM